MADAIKKLTIEGFKSIRKLEDFELRALNVLIGANGAGKTNFVSFFRLLREMIEERLQVAVAATEGGADACLYLGPKITQQFSAKLYFGRNGYEFSLVPTPDNRLIFADERTVFFGDIATGGQSLGSGHSESRLAQRRDDPGKSGAIHGVAYHVFNALSNWVVYHFHDTSLSAPVRRARPINDNEVFRPNAENLAPFLYRIQQTDPQTYSKIRDIVRLAAPFFDDFKLRPIPATPDLIQLEWLQRDSDYPFRVNQLSDGTLRFICLATALLSPLRPATVLFDEPELGLHPYALTLLGNLFKQAAVAYGKYINRQVIISTQSALLLNEFAPEEVIVVERKNGESTFRRLDSAALSEWLEDYSLGELWQKNVLGGRPQEERSRAPVNGGGDPLP
ncbi:MAG TPA: AAA family ATPase [Bryobacteraceae bacterium]|nr:AAA family ATPase [Bryobacteraceae bacterium]